MATVDATPARDPTPPSGVGEPSGLTFSVCRTVEEVEDAWGLVYNAYLRAGLISPNPARLHLVPQAISNDSAVIRGKIGGLTVSTISAYLDGPAGLPLDSVYAAELALLRDRGCRLVEIGLFADRRKSFDRSMGALLELMRYACYFGVTQEATDCVIGVHPHHARFYSRALGFEVIGEERRYETVRGNPVVLLRLDWYRKTQLNPLPRGLVCLAGEPLTPETYAQRPRLAEAAAGGSRIAAFLRGARRAAA